MKRRKRRSFWVTSEAVSRRQRVDADEPAEAARTYARQNQIAVGVFICVRDESGKEHRFRRMRVPRGAST